MACENLSAVMCLDMQGTPLFATPEARKLWDGALKDAVLRIGGSSEGIRGGIRVLHPGVPGLAVTIHLCDSHYLLIFTASDSDALLGQLTPSERRVALLVAEGLRNEEIARRLTRSRRTIEYQVNVIFRKLDMNRRTQLVRALA